MLRIKEVIKEHGYTLESFANKIGMTRSGLSQHMNGNPTVEVLDRIASALEIDVTELFEQPQKRGLIINCPHCGKEISISVKE
jgi:Helix-turn-helix.